MKNNKLQTLLVIVLVVLLVLLTDPFMFWMPEAALMFVLVGAAVLLSLWVGLVAHEKAVDEREVIHRMNAGRIAYLLGISFLTLALLIQGFSHTIDPWIPLTIGIMVLSKLVAHTYLGRHQ